MRIGIALLIAALFIGVGIAGMIRPEFLEDSLEEQYTPLRARVSGLVSVLMGVAGMWAILADKTALLRD